MVLHIILLNRFLDPLVILKFVALLKPILLDPAMLCLSYQNFKFQVLNYILCTAISIWSPHYQLLFLCKPLCHVCFFRFSSTGPLELCWTWTVGDAKYFFFVLQVVRISGMPKEVSLLQVRLGVTALYLAAAVLACFKFLFPFRPAAMFRLQYVILLLLIMLVIALWSFHFALQDLFFSSFSQFLLILPSYHLQIYVTLFVLSL